MKLALALPTLLLGFASYAQAQTALDRYIAEPDPNYAWERYGQDNDLFSTTHFLRLTSQQWRTAAEVDRPLWEHELKATVPTFQLCNDLNDSRETAMLFITGGNNADELSTDASDELVLLADNITRTVFGSIRLDLASEKSAMLRYTVNGISGTLNLTPLQL